MAGNKQHFAKEETGFSDPLGDCADFNIINFINSSNTPLDSPDPRFCQNATPVGYAPNGVQMDNGMMHPQQQTIPQQMHQQPNLPLHHQQQRPMNPVVLDQGLLYTANPNSVVSAITRLPDSPPITDISAGASSGSPSSSDSPYSPDQYANYQFVQGQVGGHPQQQLPVGHPMALNMQLGAGDQDMMTQQQHLDYTRMQQQQAMRIQAPPQTQVSPNSDFLSPYPPQTPASQHSQVSPPALNQHTNFLLDSQQSYPMELYLRGDEDLSDLNLGEYNPPAVVGASRKRQRMSHDDGESSPASMVKNEDLRFGPTSINTNIPMHKGSIGSMSGSPHGSSLDDFDECNQQRTIKFSGFEGQSWSTLYDQNQCELSQLKMSVVADKGFNYSGSDGCFVNQKKNHFQITVLIKATNENPPAYVMCSSDQTLRKVLGFKLAFCGAKAEMPSSEIQIRQSQTDRKPIPHDPVQLSIEPLKLTKVTVPRLHFSETTMNNHRKNGRPNPDQKYFNLVVKLLAETHDGLVVVQAYASDKVIVRASNPGQFDPPETEAAWQRTGANVLTCSAQVAIGTDKAINDAQLTVLGNIVSTGQHTRPSDRRVKENINSVDTSEALENLDKLRIVEYSYKPEIAKEWGLNEDSRHRVGVIAQELAEVLPDAVKDNGEFLTVDDTRIFYETVAAAQELYRLTGNLECKIDQVEQISAKLARFAQQRKRLGSASGLSDITMLLNNMQNGRKLKDGIGEEEKDMKSMMSQSRLSLVSAAPSIDPSQVGSASQYGGRSRRRGGGGKYRQQEQTLCSSKLTQGTMVGLVVIMSFCLITMCTLYVLDWYNRTYVYTIDSFPRNYPTVNPLDGVGNIVELKNWVPPEQPHILPLLASCSKRDSSTNCETYCCAARNAYNSTGERDSGPPMVDTLISLARSAPNPPPIEQTDGGRADATLAKPLDSGVEIRLLDINAPIDSRYCVEKSCMPRKGRYNLYVPMSAYMPTIALHLQINVEPGLYVDNCGHLERFQHKHCEIMDADSVGDTESFASVVPSVHKIDASTFELSATNFVQSAYRFRVGHSSDSCMMSDDQQGRSFDEYNIVFYRSCVM